MTSPLAELQDWYVSQCDGDWEHSFGIQINTLDNPGWSLCVNLEDTELEDAVFTELRENYGDDLEWLICCKHGAQFCGNGGPCQLERMIAIFLAWAKANQSRECLQPAT